MALFAISRKAVDEELQKIPRNNCFYNLDIMDWEFQQSVCLKIKEDLRLTDKDVAVGGTKNNQKLNKSLQFLFNSSMTSPKVLSSKLPPAACFIYNNLLSIKALKWVIKRIFIFATLTILFRYQCMQLSLFKYPNFRAQSPAQSEKLSHQTDDRGHRRQSH